MKWYKEGVTTTCNAMGGVEAVIGLSEAESLSMWTDIFNLNPRLMAKASIGPLAAAVPVNEIYSDQGPVHEKWQRYIKTIFVWTANNTLKLLYLDSNKKECYELWRAMPEAPQLTRELGLGSIMETPVKSGGIYDQGRRAVPKKVTYSTAYQVAVSPVYNIGCEGN